MCVHMVQENCLPIMALWDMSCTGYTSKVTTTDMYNKA